MDFIINLAPFALILLLLLPFFVRLFYKKEMSQNVKEAWEKVEKFDEKKAIEDSILLKKSLIVFLLTISIFIFHHNLGLEAATVALAGATLLLLVSNIDPAETFLEVEWSTLFFFIGLFVVIAGVEKVGIIQWLSNKIIALTKGNLTLTTLAVLWVSGITCSFINNISYTISMVPVIHNIGAVTSFNLNPVWWALSLGACLGGNGTFIAAAANLVGINILKRQGKIITFKDFFRVGLPIMLGGSPIRVAAPPMLEANISDSTRGTGDISKFSQIAKVIGTISIMVVTLSRIEDRIPVITLRKNKR
ncbi:hypothetical protein ES708_25072 [subsurface metagenome]